MPHKPQSQDGKKCNRISFALRSFTGYTSLCEGAGSARRARYSMPGRGPGPQRKVREAGPPDPIEDRCCARGAAASFTCVRRPLSSSYPAARHQTGVSCPLACEWLSCQLRKAKRIMLIFFVKNNLWKVRIMSIGASPAN